MKPAVKPVLPMNSGTLKDEVRQALLDVLRSVDAPATAKASAARTLAEFFINDDPTGSPPEGELIEMSVEELNAEIARLGKAP